MGPTRRLAAVSAALALFLLTGSPAAADVPPGFDLFETDPERTVFSFQDNFAIPEGFFAQGSAAFTGRVNLGGQPIQSFEGKDVGDADTVVRRLTAAPLPVPFPRTAEVRTELAALSLQGVAPIAVRVGDTTQLWDVRAGPSPSRPSRGDVRITQQSTQGGRFESTLEVFPRFTFTRLSDGAQRTIDLGSLPPGQTRQRLTLRALNVPWRAGCVAPALSVTALSSGFCPSFTPGRSKVLTLEQAAAAVHGVRPAQHRTEHFKCYQTQSLSRFTRRTVRLIDQFGYQSARAATPAELCNPVQKNQERLVNRQAHMRCYALDRLTPTFTQRAVRVRNQFGSEVLNVRAPRALCLPTRKGPTRREPPAITVVPDHFKCYSVRPQVSFQARTVGLRDQFENRSSRVLTPVLLCNPVEKRVGKSVTRVQHPVHHLVCYSIRDAVFRRVIPQRTVITRNQFDRTLVRTGRPTGLCVPSLKIPA